MAGEQVLIGDNDGPKDTRRFSIVPGATANVVFRYLQSQYSIFVPWFRSALKYGHKWFLLRIPGPGGIILHMVRFTGRPRGVLRGHRYWEVSAEIEIRERLYEERYVVEPPEVLYEYYSLSAGDFDHGPYASIAEAESVYGAFITAQQLGAGYDTCDVGAATYGVWGSTLEHPYGEQWMWLPCTCTLDDFPPVDFVFNNRIYRDLL